MKCFLNIQLYYNKLIFVCYFVYFYNADFQMFHLDFVLCVLLALGQERPDLGMIIHIIMQMKKAK